MYGWDFEQGRSSERTQHSTAPRGTPNIFVFSSWHLPMVLVGRTSVRTPRQNTSRDIPCRRDRAILSVEAEEEKGYGYGYGYGYGKRYGYWNGNGYGYWYGYGYGYGCRYGHGYG